MKSASKNRDDVWEDPLVHKLKFPRSYERTAFRDTSIRVYSYLKEGYTFVVHQVQ